MKHLKTYNESLRDQMTPKSKEELNSLIGDIGFNVDSIISIDVYNPHEFNLVSSASEIKQSNSTTPGWSILTGPFMLLFEYVKDYYNMTREEALRTIKKDLIQNESLRDHMKPKSEDEINKFKDEINNVYIKQEKANYEFLKYLESIGFTFDYDTERIKNDNFEPQLSSQIGNFLITDFIKEHKKVLYKSEEFKSMWIDDAWEKNMDNNIKPKLIKILDSYGFILKPTGMRYGGGDLLVEFTVPEDSKYQKIKRYPKLISDTLANESLIDKMKPKSEEDIIKSLSKLDSHDRFMYAIEYGVLDVVKELIEERKVDLHESNERALEIAIFYNHDDIIEYLLNKGANPNADKGRLMRHPINRNNMKQIKMLLDHGFELNEPVWNHSEMLYIALRDNKPEEMIELFLKHGAKIGNSEKLKKAYPKYADIIDKYKK